MPDYFGRTERQIQNVIGSDWSDKYYISMGRAMLGIIYALLAIAQAIKEK